MQTQYRKFDKQISNNCSTNQHAPNMAKYNQVSEVQLVIHQKLKKNSMKIEK
jgi:hypothetical protein